MNATKTKLVKRLYNRQRTIANADRLVLAIRTGSLRQSTFILDQSYKLAGRLPIFDSAEVTSQNKKGMSVIPGRRFKKTQDFRIATAEEAIYKELEEKNLLFAYERGVWSKWEFIRAYHLIEITIAIAVGVYLWLK